MSQADRASWVARVLSGAPPVPTQAELVREFSFDGSTYYCEGTRYNCARPVGHRHYRFYRRPSRGELLAKILARIVEGSDGFPGRKRPKLLAGAVLKRCYGTYPETQPFIDAWQKAEDDLWRKEEEEAAHRFRRHHDKSKLR